MFVSVLHGEHNAVARKSMTCEQIIMNHRQHAGPDVEQREVGNPQGVPAATRARRLSAEVTSIVAYIATMLACLLLNC